MCENDTIVSISYIELIPALIKGMQEQQEVINQLTITVSNQQDQINLL